jgi:hypothetical protein
MFIQRSSFPIEGANQKYPIMQTQVNTSGIRLIGAGLNIAISDRRLAKTAFSKNTKPERLRPAHRRFSFPQWSQSVNYGWMHQQSKCITDFLKVNILY